MQDYRTRKNRTTASGGHLGNLVNDETGERAEAENTFVQQKEEEEATAELGNEC